MWIFSFNNFETLPCFFQASDIFNVPMNNSLALGIMSVAPNSVALCVFQGG